MLNIAIVDDEEAQAKLLSVYAAAWAKQNNKVASVHTYSNAESFYFEWCENKSFDVLLLDIQMDGMNGIELAKEIRKHDENLSIIFITGLSDYIQEGYEVSALHYLIKPVDEEKLYACLDRACIKVKREQPSIVINSDSETVRILQEELIYAEAFAHTIFLQTVKSGFEARMNIGELEKALLPDLFIRCHRSYIAGLKYISKIGKSELMLDTGKSIPVSRRLYNKVNQAFIRFYRKGVE